MMTALQAEPAGALCMCAMPDGTELAYRMWGEGTIPVVFVHGYSMSLAAWGRIAPLVPARYRAYAFDLRGFGHSGKGPPYSHMGHVRDIASFLDAMQLDHAVMVGHSLGGNLLQDFAIDHPGRLKALVLASSSPRILPPPDPVANRVEERLALFRTPEGLRGAMEIGVPRYFHLPNVTDAELSFWTDVALQADPRALSEMLASNYSIKARMTAEFGAIAAPVLAIAGEYDPMAPPERLAEYASMFPDSETVVMLGCGHTPMWERPQRWSDAVFGFLGRKI